MNHKFFVSVTATALSIAVVASGAQAGSRGIKCRGSAQLVAGSYIITPFCQDELLASVARGYGMRASAERIRYNPNYKREVCRLVGQDIRVSEHCLNEVPGFRGRRF
jgi:hypothetical protein